MNWDGFENPIEIPFEIPFELDRIFDRLFNAIELGPSSARWCGPCHCAAPAGASAGTSALSTHLEGASGGRSCSTSSSPFSSG